MHDDSSERLQLSMRLTLMGPARKPNGSWFGRRLGGVRLVNNEST